MPRRRKRLSERHLFFGAAALASLAAVAAVTAGCGVKTTRVVPTEAIRPTLEATREDLLARYDRLARGVRSLNAAIELRPTTGSAYTGVIEEYREVSGFLLAARPASVRMIGQAPVVAKNIFDMTSDGRSFRIYIPSRGKFIIGPAASERRSEKPIENLRPQHLLDAIFWPEMEPGATVLFEEFDQPPYRYYVLTVLGRAAGDAPPEIARKMWFDRADLSLARLQIFAAGGRRSADIRYRDWQPAGDVAGGYPRGITLERPMDDYRLELRITRLTLNEEVAAERFRLEQPPGTELVRVEADAGERP